ncbi:MAG: carboxypeptidase regulatory-like domain-containing protein [Candidatus Acidiferrales bacterium]
MFRGSLTGTVVDASGAVVPAAKIVVRAPDFGFERDATSNARGEFRFDDLTPGEYIVTVSAKGFAEARAEVTVVVSAVRELAVKLQPAPLEEKVIVDGEGSITTQPLDTSTAVHQATVTAQDLETLPLAGRSFANIAYLAPGTEPVEPSDPTKARITAVSTGGSSGLNNEVSVDGADNSDDYIGGFLQNFSPDAIQEFAVRTALEDADTGRTTAGSVVITTKAGTDEWHGDAAIFVRDAALNARFPIDNPAPNPKQPFSRQNYAGTIGGPIQRDKLFFFASFEYVHENASLAYSPASLAQFNELASLASQGLIPGANSIAVPTSVAVPFLDYLSTMRLDWAQSERSRWFLRAASDDYTTRNALVQQAALPATGAESHNNYMNLAISNEFTFSPEWEGSLVVGASGLHLTESRNSQLGFALAFPFTSTSSTISGLETFGDNQFITPITAFPILRNQEKYQVRYDVIRAGRHTPRFGVSFIHEPVLSGALTATQETLTTFQLNPADYIGNPKQFSADLICNQGQDPALPLATPNTTCVTTPAGDGSFVQNVQRLGLYVEDSWKIRAHFTLNYGVRYDTTFGLFRASGRSQLQNPALLTLRALSNPLVSSAPQDYRGAIAPRIGIVYAPGQSERTVIRAGFGLYYNDLAQSGWVTALQAVNTAPGTCVIPGDPGCLPAASPGALIDPHYKTPYALHVTAGVQHAFNQDWSAGADWTHEEGNHAYRRYQYEAGFTIAATAPSVTVFRTDNRSRYDAMSLHLQGNMSRRFSLVMNYTLSSAETWGCVLGELFDYVNGVCNPLNAFGKGDYGPSGEDVTHRFVLAGTLHAPGGFELTTLTQAESARPFTLTTSVPVNGLGDSFDNRAVVNGVSTNLDQFRGTPYIQADLRVSRPIKFRERISATPFIEFFNLFNRNNPGANFVTNVAALPVPQNEVQAGNITDVCTNAACTTTTPITNLNQLRVPAGALGDFFGPGTTVGIPFAAQIGFRLDF